MLRVNFRAFDNAYIILMNQRIGRFLVGLAVSIVLTKLPSGSSLKVVISLINVSVAHIVLAAHVQRKGITGEGNHFLTITKPCPLH